MNRGFSLLELIVVVAVIAVMASLAVPQITRSMDGYRLSASASTVANELNAARAMAVARNWNYIVVVGSGSIQIRESDDTPARSRRPLDTGISASVTVDGSEPNIKFYSRGHADGGTITLTNQSGATQTITVTAAGKIE